MTKYIDFLEEGGRVWRINGHIVADHRAKYYAENDLSTTYEEEYNYTIGDDDELLDWLWNNMDIEDFGELELVRDIDPLPQWGRILSSKVVDSDD